MKQTALLIIDLQNDFMPGGTLPILESEQIIPILNRLMPFYPLVVATQNWYPKNHAIFASNHQGVIPFQQIKINGARRRLLPDHCIAGSHGAELHPELLQHDISAIFRKGMHAKTCGYSAFYDDEKTHHTGLSSYLKAHEIRHLHVAGLATDDSIYHTIKDGLDENFTVTLIEPATRVRDNARSKRQSTELFRYRKFILAHSLPFIEMAMLK